MKASTIIDSTFADFERYYGQYGAQLADTFSSNGYEASLWHYPESDLYEVNIGVKGADWADPATHTDPAYRGRFIAPAREFGQKLAEWLAIRGHLAFGTHNPRRFEVYKRLLKRMVPEVKFLPVPWEVPGGGQYVVAVTTDHDVLDRARPGPEDPRHMESLLVEMPYYRMQRDNARTGDDPGESAFPTGHVEKDDVIIPEAPAIEVHTGDHHVFYRLLNQYRHAGDSCNNERIGQFVALHKQPDDALYYIRQRGGWNQGFWILLNPEEHRKLLGEIVRLHLNEEMSPSDKEKWTKAFRAFTIANLVYPITKFKHHDMWFFINTLEDTIDEGDSDLVGHVEDFHNYETMYHLLDFVNDHVDEQDQIRLASPAFQNAFKRALAEVARRQVGKVLGDAVERLTARSVIDEMAEFHIRDKPEDYPGSAYRRRYLNRPGRPDSAQLAKELETVRITHEVSVEQLLVMIQPFRHALDYGDMHYTDTFELVSRFINDQFKTGDRLVRLSTQGLATSAGYPDRVDHIFMLVSQDEEHAFNRFKTELERIRMASRLKSP